MKKQRNRNDINKFYKFFWELMIQIMLSSVRDIAIMSKYLIKNYPKYYELFKEKHSLGIGLAVNQ